MFFRIYTEWSLLLDYHLFGLNPKGYYIHNILLKAIQAFILFLLAQKIAGKLNISPAGKYGWLTAFFFIFSSSHTEAVVWISGRTALLASIWGCLSIYFYLLFKESNRRPYLFLGLFSFIISLFNYESVWLIPLMIMVLEFIDKNSRRKRFIPFLYILCFGIYEVIKYYNVSTFMSGYADTTLTRLNFSLWFRNMGTLLLRSFIPSFEKPVYFISIGLFLLLLLGLLFIFYRNIIRQYKKVFLPLILLYLLALAPVSMFGIDTHYSQNERYLYFPSVFFSLIPAMIIFRMPKASIPLWAGLSLFILLQIFAIQRTNNRYRKASFIVRETNTILRKQKKDFAVYGVPDSYKGAYIFRHGFKENYELIRRGRPNYLKYYSKGTRMDNGHKDDALHILLFHPKMNKAGQKKSD